MSTPSEYAGVPIILDLPEPFAGYPKVSVVNIDVPARTIHFHLVNTSGAERGEFNTARFDGTFTPEAIAADILNELKEHA